MSEAPLITTGTSNEEPAFTDPGGFIRKFTFVPFAGATAGCVGGVAVGGGGGSAAREAAPELAPGCCAATFGCEAPVPTPGFSAALRRSLIAAGAAAAAVCPLYVPMVVSAVPV